MAVGYAAFATNLNITGLSNIDTSWDVRITNITTSDIKGGATNQSSSYDRLTANFSANLVSPGDSITYNITVANQGTLDAVLDSITNNSTANEHIDVSISGIEERQILYSNSTRILKVVITFKDEELSGLTGTNNVNISLTLNYVQNTTNMTVNNGVTINYNSRGGNEIASIQQNLKDEVNVSSIPVRLGYSFDGWYDKNRTGKYIESGTLVIDLLGGDTSITSKTIYAYWNQKHYDIKYEVGIGTIASGFEDFYYYGAIWEEPIYNPDVFEPSGYTLDAWYTGENGTGVKVTEETTVGDIIQYLYGSGVDEGPNGEKEFTLYANWVPSS